MKVTIKGLRTSLKLTQDEMAKRLGLSRSTYIWYEQHPIEMPIKYALQIVEATGGTLDNIDYGDSESL